MMMNYKNIGDTLTTAELNAYASLLAHNKVLNDSFNLKNGKIIGEYGEYAFDLTNASIIDNGVLITDETLSNDITVTLENPTQYASYTLHLTVLRYDEVHLLDEDTPNTETIELTIDLVKDTSVVIPMTDLQEYDVILFNSNITIRHDQPEIKGAYVTSLQLTSDKLILQNGESATLTVTALDLDTLPVANKPIKLYKNGTLLDTLTTDSNGQAITSITASSLAEISLVAKYQGTITSEELVINDANLFDLSVTSNKDIMQTGETATLTATLLGDDTPLAGESISFEVYHNNVLQETLSGTTDSSGVASVGYVGKGTGVLNIQAFAGERIISSRTYPVTDALLTDLPEILLTGGKNYVKSPSDDGYDWEVPVCAEFDIASVTNPSNFRFRLYERNTSSENSIIYTLSQMGITDNDYHHVKIVAYENRGLIYVDGNNVSNLPKTFITLVRINFTTINAGGSSNVKNFMIYTV